MTQLIKFFLKANEMEFPKEIFPLETIKKYFFTANQIRFVEYKDPIKKLKNPTWGTHT